MHKRVIMLTIQIDVMFTRRTYCRPWTLPTSRLSSPRQLSHNLPHCSKINRNICIRQKTNIKNNNNNKIIKVQNYKNKTYHHSKHKLWNALYKLYKRYIQLIVYASSVVMHITDYTHHYSHNNNNNNNLHSTFCNIYSLLTLQKHSTLYTLTYSITYHRAVQVK